jgi:hypothetical protein
LPLPLDPDVVVIQLAPLAAVHVQPLGAVTVTVPVPPLAAAEALTGAMAQPQGSPAWFTVKVCPAMVTVPLRALLLLFAATE